MFGMVKAFGKQLNNYSDNRSEDACPISISMFQQYIRWCPTYSIIPAFQLLIRILRNNPTKSFLIQDMSVFKRLDKLLIETSYDSDSQYMDFDQKLEVRQISSVLTATLWSFFKSESSPISEVINRWREACLSPDEFAEIRIPWSGVENNKKTNE
jgi:hypothetical protein